MKIPSDWSFDTAEVAENFDIHVREQLPFYDLVSGAVAHIARHYLPENGLLYDIGASTGNLTNILGKTIRARNITAVSVESSVEMSYKFAGVGQLFVCDCLDVKYEKFDVAVLFLVLMFIPVSERFGFMEKLIEQKKEGGAIIVVDKINQTAGYLGTIMRRLTLAGKVANGASHEDIINKELSLEGIQRPIDDEEFSSLGTKFFQFGEFAGWVIE